MEKKIMCMGSIVLLSVAIMFFAASMVEVGVGGVETPYEIVRPLVDCSTVTWVCLFYSALLGLGVYLRR